MESSAATPMEKLYILYKKILLNLSLTILLSSVHQATAVLLLTLIVIFGLMIYVVQISKALWSMII